MREDDAAEALLGFAHHERVEVVTTDAGDGGWYMEVGSPDNTRDLVPVTNHKGGPWTETAVWPLTNLEQVAGAFPGQTADAFSALLLAGAASRANADALATRNPILLNPPAPWSRRDNAMTPEEAIALMGLYLRLQGDFTWLQGGNFERDEKTPRPSTGASSIGSWRAAFHLLHGVGSVRACRVQRQRETTRSLGWVGAHS